MKTLYYLLLLIQLFSCNQPEKESIPQEKSVVVDSLSKLNNQRISKPLVNKVKYDKFLKFIPQGYEIFSVDSGHLNADSFQDYLLIVNDTNERIYYKNDFVKDSVKARTAFIILGTHNDSLQIASKNSNVVLGLGMGGLYRSDPFDGASIDNGDICFFSQGGGFKNRWSNQECFSYDDQQKNWFLESITEQLADMEDTISHPPRIKTKKDFGIVTFESYGDFSKK